MEQLFDNLAKEGFVSRESAYGIDNTYSLNERINAHILSLVDDDPIRQKVLIIDPESFDDASHYSSFASELGSMQPNRNKLKEFHVSHKGDNDYELSFKKSGHLKRIQFKYDSDWLIADVAKELLNTLKPQGGRIIDVTSGDLCVYIYVSNETAKLYSKYLERNAAPRDNYLYLDEDGRINPYLYERYGDIKIERRQTCRNIIESLKNYTGATEHPSPDSAFPNIDTIKPKYSSSDSVTGIYYSEDYELRNTPVFLKSRIGHYYPNEECYFIVLDDNADQVIFKTHGEKISYIFGEAQFSNSLVTAKDFTWFIMKQGSDVTVGGSAIDLLLSQSQYRHENNEILVSYFDGLINKVSPALTNRGFQRNDKFKDLTTFKKSSKYVDITLAVDVYQKEQSQPARIRMFATYNFDVLRENMRNKENFPKYGLLSRFSSKDWYGDEIYTDSNDYLTLMLEFFTLHMDVSDGAESGNFINLIRAQEEGKLEFNYFVVEAITNYS